MDHTSRIVIAGLVLLTAVGCGSKGASDAAPADTATPTKATATPPAHTAAPAPTHAPAPTATAAPTPAPDAAYRWETHKVTNLKFELPAAWTTSVTGNVLVAKTPTPGVGVEFNAVSGGLSTKSDEKLLLAEVGKTLKDVKTTAKMKPVEQHGLKGFSSAGRGKKDGQEVDWIASAVSNGHGGAMLTLGFWGPNTTPADKAAMVRVLDSIQPAT